MPQRQAGRENEGNHMSRPILIARAPILALGVLVVARQDRCAAQARLDPRRVLRGARWPGRRRQRFRVLCTIFAVTAKRYSSRKRSSSPRKPFDFNANARRFGDGLELFNHEMASGSGL